MSRVIHLIDRSRVEAREECPRMRFLNYDYDNDGLDTEEQSLPLLSGTAIHAAHARLLAGQDLDTVVSEIITGYVDEIKLRGLYGIDLTADIIREQAALLEGMLRTWAVVRMPLLLEEYEVVSIEQRQDWELFPGLVERMRKDAILRRRDDGLKFILDYKTLKYPSEMWMEKFEHSLQTCLYLQSEKELSSEPLGGIIYEGLVKGEFRKDTAKSSPWYGQKIQNSPYTIAYKLGGDDGLALYQTDYTPKKGYRKVKTFEEMPMKEWVNHHLLPSGQAHENFIIVPPIMPPNYELERVKQQTVREELEYFDRLGKYRSMLANDSVNAESYLDIVAPLRTGRCDKYGRDNSCKFKSICFNQGARPLEEGGFIKRKPHHDTDLIMVT